MSKEIDYLPATHRLNELMYEVSLEGIVTEGNLFNYQRSGSFKVPHYLAVVDKVNNKVISIVSDNYKLITNMEALEWGKSAFKMLFPNVKTEDLIPYKVIAPKSKASCHIDLIHKGTNFKIWEQETWLPYLRVSNSYNRTQTLSFEIGFVRELCSNGVLFNKKTVKIKYPHNKGQRMELNVDIEQLKPLETKFKLSCLNLKTIPVRPEYMFALICQILHINLNFNPYKAEKQKESLIKIKNQVFNLTESYFKDLDPNAYAALSVLTDLISHQDDYNNLTGFSLNPNSYYYKTADWIIDFAENAGDSSFRFDSYLKETVSKLDNYKKETNFEWLLKSNVKNQNSLLFD